MGGFEAERVRTYNGIKEDKMAEKEIVFLNEHGDIEFCGYIDLPRMERNLQILEKTNIPFRKMNSVLNLCRVFKGEIVQIKKKEEVIFSREKE